MKKLAVKKKYITLFLIFSFVVLLLQFIPLINCSANKDIDYVGILNEKYVLINKNDEKENIKYLNEIGKEIALAHLKLSHTCTPYFAIPNFLVYEGNTYISENNTYIYQYKYDVYGVKIFSDMGGWMAGDGLIQDGIFTTSIKYKNRYLEFKKVGDKLEIISYGKMYGI
ncbi:MAG TPA: hypothetical protein PKH06_01420 [Candidatus Dojkabacteria bacterium]|nr:hypothetical protein [Candidatus Dojkabacteria bacterium]